MLAKLPRPSYYGFDDQRNAGCMIDPAELLLYAIRGVVATYIDMVTDWLNA